jgi:hypothetical protein
LFFTAVTIAPFLAHLEDAIAVHISIIKRALVNCDESSMPCRFVYRGPVCRGLFSIAAVMNQKGSEPYRSFGVTSTGLF